MLPSRRASTWTPHRPQQHGEDQRTVLEIRNRLRGHRRTPSRHGLGAVVEGNDRTGTEQPRQIAFEFGQRSGRPAVASIVDTAEVRYRRPALGFAFTLWRRQRPRYWSSRRCRRRAHERRRRPRQPRIVVLQRWRLLPLGLCTRWIRNICRPSRFRHREVFPTA